MTITVQLTGGANAVLSGIFLGEAPALQSPRHPRATGWAPTGDPATRWRLGTERSDADLPPRCHAQLGRRQPLPVELLDHRRTCPRERRPVDPGGDLLVRELRSSSCSSRSARPTAGTSSSTRSTGTPPRRETISVNDGSSPQTVGTHHLLQRRGMGGVPHQRRVRWHGDHHRAADRWSQRCAVGDLPGGPGIAVSTPRATGWAATGDPATRSAAWNGSSDATYLPYATLSLVEGNRDQWNSSTTDVRALESPDQSTREATCWYANSQLQLQSSFNSCWLQRDPRSSTPSTGTLSPAARRSA